jgi:hypothetical protein
MIFDRLLTHKMTYCQEACRQGGGRARANCFCEICERFEARVHEARRGSNASTSQIQVSMEDAGMPIGTPRLPSIASRLLQYQLPHWSPDNWLEVKWIAHQKEEESRKKIETIP